MKKRLTFLVSALVLTTLAVAILGGYLKYALLAPMGFSGKIVFCRCLSC